MAFNKEDAEKLQLVDRVTFEDAIKDLRLYHDSIIFMYHDLAEDEDTEDDDLIMLEDEAAVIKAVIDKLESSIVSVYSKTPQNGFH